MWAKTFFNDLYGQLFLAWTQDQAQQTCSHIMNLLGVSQGDTVFDQCCGTGEMDWGFLQQGVGVVGCDLNPSYIQHAQKTTRNFSNAHFYVAQAERWAPPQNIQGALCWHSSLGYGTKSDAKRQVTHLRKQLDPGRRWLLEFHNPAWLRRNFQAVLSQVHHVDGRDIHIQRQSSFKKCVMRQVWIFSEHGKILHQSPPTRMHVFSAHEWIDWAKKRGDQLVFKVGEDGEKLHPQHKRMTLVFEKRHDLD
jgi:SAM-dependent methyltransferase